MVDIHRPYFHWGLNLLLAGTLGVLLLGSASFAQAPATSPPAPTSTIPPAAQPGVPAAGQPTPAATQPTSAPADRARVVEVRGSVEYAPVGTDPTDRVAWQPVTEGQELGPDTMIRTGMRANCTLIFGTGEDITVISVRRGTLAAITDFTRTPEEQRIRIGLGYGAIRGGSSAGMLRSDVVIDSTVATLAKRGTEGFEMKVEPTRGQYRISLAESGLVDALDKLRDARREVRPGEYVDRTSIARLWVNQNVFNRTVRFYEAESVSAADLDFMTDTTTGLAAMGPGMGREAWGYAGRGEARFAALGNAGGTRPAQPMTVLQARPVVRPEGNFGFAPSLRLYVPAGR